MSASTTKTGRLRKLWRHLRTENTTSAKLSLAVGVGIFIGLLPFYGFHFPLSVGAAWVLRVNKLTTYLAANISNPLLSPFLIFGSVQLGERLTRGRTLALTVSDLSAVGPSRFFGSWLVGSLLLGALLGALGFALTFLATTRRRRREREPAPSDPFPHLVAELAARYRPAGAWAHGYVKQKLLHDPAFRTLFERVLPDRSRMLDVGTGRGQLALWMALRDPSTAVLGIDWDSKKLRMARKAAEGCPNVSFEEVDLFQDFRLAGPFDHVFVLDVLHYLPIERQDALLRASSAALGSGGSLWIRELDLSSSLRARLTVLEERVFTWIGFNRGRVLAFRPLSEIARILEATGLETTTEPMWGKTPFANCLLRATLRSDDDTPRSGATEPRAPTA